MDLSSQRLSKQVIVVEIPSVSLKLPALYQPHNELLSVLADEQYQVVLLGNVHGASP
jgi:hypothetical protein